MMSQYKKFLSTTVTVDFFNMPQFHDMQMFMYFVGIGEPQIIMFNEVPVLYRLVCTLIQTTIQ